MLVLLSPAKTLDFDTQLPVPEHTQPIFLDDASELVDQLKQLAPDEIANLMKLSDKLATLNAQRYYDFKRPFTENNAKAAMLAFQGDVYTGLQADQFSQAQLKFAQKHVRMLSGLYGVLKPLDLMQPYRLEMGTRFNNTRGNDLYAFWGERITQALNDELSTHKHACVINLASNEYFKSVKVNKLAAPVITPVFKDEKNGQYKIISFYAKKARGLMTRFMVQNKLTKKDDLKAFDLHGYRFDVQGSNNDTWLFTRSEKDRDAHA